MRKLILHAGIQRTGTTSIQLHLADMRDILTSHGYCYPGRKPHHQDWAWGINSGKRSGSDLREWLAQTSGTVILSGEGMIVNRDLSWLNPILEDFDVSVFVTLRRQDDWLMSWYNQHVRWPFDNRKSQMTSAQFLETLPDYHWLDYRALSERWIAKVGRKHLHFSLMGDDQVTNFFNKACPEIPAPKDQKSVNSSVCAATLEVLKQFDVINLRNFADRKALINAVSQVVPNDGVSAVYSPTERAAIVQQFSEGNLWIGKEYFGFNGSPFEDVPQDAPFRAVGEYVDRSVLNSVVHTLAKRVRNL